MSEPTPRFRARLKFRRPRVSQSRSKRELINYQRFYNAHARGSVRSHRLQASVEHGISWSGEDKDNFFRALGRHGQSRIDRVAADVGKSVLACASYLHTLRSALTLQEKSTPVQLSTYRDFPAAVEVDDSTLAREEYTSRILAREGAVKYHAQQSRIGWTLISAREAAEVHDMVQHMSSEQMDLFHQTAPDLLALDFRRFVHDSSPCATSSSARDSYARNHVDGGDDGDDNDNDNDNDRKCGIYRNASEALYEHYKAYLYQLMHCALDVATRRGQIEQGAYFQDSRFKDIKGIGARDIYAALDLLSPQNHADARSNSSIGERNGNDQENQHGVQETMSGALGNGNDMRIANVNANANVDSQEHSDDGEELEELDSLLEKYDAQSSVPEENEYRRFLGLEPLPLPQALTAKELSKLGKLLAQERLQQYETSDFSAD